MKISLTRGRVIGRPMRAGERGGEERKFSLFPRRRGEKMGEKNGGKKVEGTEINLCMLILLPPRHKSEDAETRATVWGKTRQK